MGDGDGDDGKGERSGDAIKNTDGARLPFGPVRQQHQTETIVLWNMTNFELHYWHPPYYFQKNEEVMVMVMVMVMMIVNCDGELVMETSQHLVVHA